MNVRLFAIYGPRFLQSEIGGELQTCGSVFHCRRRQTHGVLLWYTSRDIEDQHLGCGSAQPQPFRVSGPWDMRGKMGPICSGSTHQALRFASQESDFPAAILVQWKTLKKKRCLFPRLWQAAKKYVHCRVKWSSSWSPPGGKLFISKWVRIFWLILALSTQHSLQVLLMELSGVRLPVCIHPFLFPGNWPINCFDQIKFWHLVQNGNFQVFQA